MTPARHETHVLRLLRATAVLAMFYVILFRLPIPGAASKALQPGALQKLQERSAEFRRSGKWSRALEPAGRLHAEYPENHIYIDNLAEIYAHLGRYREEAAMWELFLTRAPLPGEGCPQIGQAYEKQGKTKETLDAFERCLALDPADTDSIYYLAHTLERQGFSERAAAMYERGVALSPNYSDLQIGLARMRMRQDRISEAKQIAEAVVKRSPD
ncbi:MAG: tetratricopeptide repeat protein, partial [Acidobacteriota bacterium]|nr:tetratricopeptide repeat protein [Acidobacteriota bacterium]